MKLILALLMKTISTELAKTVIGFAINKLLAHGEDGITKDIAKTMIDGICKSKSNPVEKDIVEDAIKLLQQN